jgi:hypothetical protein
MIRQTVQATFAGDLSALPARAVPVANRTWLKNTASSLGGAIVGDERVPLVGRWSLGEGGVLATALTPSTFELDAMVRLMARAPRDPRFRVTWNTGAMTRVTVDAIAGSYLNGAAIDQDLVDAADGGARQHVHVPQTGPGRYSVAVPGPYRPAFATVRHDGAAIDRVALAGRYPAEFDALGTDFDALHHLADATGGAVIEASQSRPIDLPRETRRVSLGSWLAAAGALALGLSLLVWRRGRS